jgi:uncharacterized protein YecT (DUF1311 family)
MIRFVAIVAGGLTLLSAAASATECDRNDPTQIGLNRCAQADFAVADAKLNQLYKQLIAKSGADEKTALRDTQRAWVAYRDKECEYETIGSAGGSIRPMEEWECATALTEARAKDFAKFLAGE